ncbi:hypothetical protein [Streptococcus suis]|uniref:hypothetical protein n=1 Tax=Streptococcus suis TaxID=1307 RepID=UPI000943F981|nr:hypothetical protein [Streptococcus suis]
MKWKSWYSHLVSLLLLRRARKRRFLISNFKHSTGVFEVALPENKKAKYISWSPRNKKALSYACGSLPCTKSKLNDYISEKAAVGLLFIML